MTNQVETKILQLLHSSSCFGREVCLSAPCACAKSLADLVAQEREQCAKVADGYGCGNSECEECIGNQIAAAIRAGER